MESKNRRAYVESSYSDEDPSTGDKHVSQFLAGQSAGTADTSTVQEQDDGYEDTSDSDGDDDDTDDPTDPDTTSLNDEKPTLNEKSLKNRGIYMPKGFIGEDTQHSTPSEEPSSSKTVVLPWHVQALRLALLELDCSIPKQFRTSFEREHADLKKKREERGQDGLPDSWATKPEETIYWKPEIAFQSHKQKAALESAEIDAISRVANKLVRQAGEAEPEWQGVLVNNVFRTYEEEIPDQQRDKVMALFDSWRWYLASIYTYPETMSLTVSHSFQNTLWNDIPDSKYVKGGSPGPTRPKPDVTYAFPIFQPDARLPRGFKQDDCTENFCVDYLKRLREEPKEGLVTSPTTGLLNKDSDSLSLRDLSCFPWAVVEFKRDELPQTNEEKCYYQAANAAATALLYQRAVFDAAYGRTIEDLPPVVAFTCIGPEAKVWLAFWDVKRKKRRNFICIFTTHMELTWGVYAIRLILKNVRIWASRILRPRLSACLTLIRMNSSQKFPRTMQDTPQRLWVTETPRSSRSGKQPAGLNIRRIREENTPADSVAGSPRYGFLSSPLSHVFSRGESIGIPRTPPRTPARKPARKAGASKAIRATQSEEARHTQEPAAEPLTPPDTQPRLEVRPSTGRAISPRELAGLKTWPETQAKLALR